MAAEVGGTDVGGDIGADGGEEFGEFNLLGILLHLLLERTLEPVGAFEEVFDRSELVDELDGGLFADTGAAGDIVDLIAHEGEEIDDLPGVLNAISGADLLLAAEFEILATVGGLVL